MWFLGVVAWGPTPSSHMCHPLDPLLWRSARELIEGFSPTLLTRIFLGSRFLHRYSLFIIPFSHFTFTPLLLSVVQAFCTSAVFIVPLLLSVVQAFCTSAVFIVLMQSSFSVRNMDSTPEPPSPNMAAAASSQEEVQEVFPLSF